jgi:hypothetical protein
MRGAADTPDERLRAYETLFERALVRRERRVGSVVFHLRDDPGVRETVDELARREALCCPFLGYRVESAPDAVIWTITGDDRASADAILDAFPDLPNRAIVT